MQTGSRARRVTSAPPKFVIGSILRHILVMTGTGAAGLMAIFLGDLANILFLSWVGDDVVIAAVGYASSILFLTISMGIGLSIAATSLVSPALGAGRRMRARRLSLNAHVLTFVAASLLSLVIWLLIPQFLELLGATGRAYELATVYLLILVPALPPLAVAMTSASVLRSAGDARRAMNVTLIGAPVNTLLDAILILGLGLGIQGAAIASALARLVMMTIGLYGVVWVHDLWGRLRVRTVLADAPAHIAVAVPAVLTNIATPVANAYVTRAMAPFGDTAVAGWAIVGRVIPVAFGAIFALSATVGPIIGQNYGAGAFDRVRAALTQSLLVTAAFTGIAWAILAVLAWPIAGAFDATGETADLIVFFCRALPPSFVFLGALFVANAAFNTLGRPHYSTALNWGRATLGTVPLVQAGAVLAGAVGVLAGSVLGGVIFGILAVWLAYRWIDQLANKSHRADATRVAGKVRSGAAG
ncbi:MAG: MATE family efflux transporter [Hyphomicrobium sp.]|nr:MATE family efflux transporter [Hyphomicrobium sp.]